MVLPLIIALVLLAYSCLIFLLERGLHRLSSSVLPSEGDDSPGNVEALCIVIPFKNEEKTLPLVLADMAAQEDCPAPFRVLLVDDHSSDASVKVVESFVRDQPAFSLLRLPVGSKGKKQALAMGIENADAPWILQVDADCRVGRGFVASHMYFAASRSCDLVAGALNIDGQGRSFREVFEMHDVLSLTGTGAGSFHYGRPLMCSGANLMYRRELHQESRDFDPDELASGDDMFLLIGARKLGKRSCYNIDPEALVLTPAQKSWSALLRQRMRWGAKSTHYPMPDIKAVAFLVALANLLLALLPLWLCLFPEALGVLLLTAGLKFMMDFILILAMAGMVKQQAVLRWYLPVALLYPYYMVLLLLAMPFRGRQW